MATHESQNPTDSSPAILAAAPETSDEALGPFMPNWVGYAMLVAVGLFIAGAPLALLGEARNNSTMLLIGAICFTVSTVVWVGPLVFFGWKTIETGRIAVPIIWRRIRQ